MKSSSFYADLVSSDFSELTLAAKNLAVHATQHLGSLGFGTSFLQWFAAAAAMLVTFWILFFGTFVGNYVFL